MMKFFSILALAAAFSSVTPSAFASEDALAPPSDPSVREGMEWGSDNDLDARRHGRWDNRRDWHGRGYACFARNARGRTFVAYGNYRMPRYSVQRRAVNMCQRGSAFILRSTCRPMGCR